MVAKVIHSKEYKTRQYIVQVTKCSSNYDHMVDKTIDLSGLCQLVVLIRPSREPVDNLWPQCCLMLAHLPLGDDYIAL